MITEVSTACKSRVVFTLKQHFTHSNWKTKKLHWPVSITEEKERIWCEILIFFFMSNEESREDDGKPVKTVLVCQANAC